MQQPLDFSAEEIKPYVPELEQRVQEINEELAKLMTDKAQIEKLINEFED